MSNIWKFFYATSIIAIGFQSLCYCLPTARHVANINNFKSNTKDFIKQNLPFSDKNLGNNISAIYQDVEDNVWVGAFQLTDHSSELSSNLLYVKMHNTNEFKAYAGFPANVSSLKNIFEDKAENMYVGTTSGFYEKKLGETNFVKYANEFIGGINSITEDSAGYIWIGSTTGLWFSSDYGKTFVEKLKGLPENSWVQTVYIDKENNIWVGEKNDLYYKKFDDDSFIHIPTEGIMHNVWFITKDFKKGDVWIGALNGLFKYNLSANVFTKYNLQNNDDRISSIFVDGDGGIWVASSQENVGVWKKSSKSNKFIKFANFQKQDSDSYFSFYKNKENYLWLGGNNSVYLSNFKMTENNTVEKPLPIWIIIVVVPAILLIIIAFAILWYFWHKNNLKIYFKKLNNDY